MTPLIEQLADARTDMERAAWLLACPLAVLLTDEATIRQALQAAGFAQGLKYLEIETAALRGMRDIEGWPPLYMQRMVARGVMHWRAIGNPFDAWRTLL